MAEHNLSQLVQLAANARAEADAAVLDNVRDRCLRAEAAWLEMAARARRAADLKDRQAEEKAARPPFLYVQRGAPSLPSTKPSMTSVED